MNYIYKFCFFLIFIHIGYYSCANENRFQRKNEIESSIKDFILLDEEHRIILGKKSVVSKKTFPEIKQVLSGVGYFDSNNKWIPIFKNVEIYFDGKKNYLSIKDKSYGEIIFFFEYLINEENQKLILFEPIDNKKEFKVIIYSKQNVENCEIKVSIWGGKNIKRVFNKKLLSSIHKRIVCVIDSFHYLYLKE